MKAPGALGAVLLAATLTSCALPLRLPSAQPSSTAASADETPSVRITPTPQVVPSSPQPTSPLPTKVLRPAEQLTSPDRGRRALPPVKPQGFVDPPAGQGMERYLGQKLNWQPCGQDNKFQCAETTAPLDYQRPDGQALTLSMLKVPATKTPKLGTIFVNPGGPGGEAQGLAARFKRDGLEQYDIVGWDPRGTGKSTPVVCGSDRELDAYLDIDTSPDDAAERQTMIEASRRFGEQCLQQSGALLQHISTVDTVQDLDLLRALVGDEKLNYFGYSYGTDIGSRYADMYPQRVGRVALDSAVNVSNERVYSQVASFERTLGNFADWCAKRNCYLGNSREQVLDNIKGVLTDLDAKPLQVGDRKLTQSLALTGMMMTLYGQEREWEYLSLGVREAQRGDGTVLLTLADFYNGRDKGHYDNQLIAFPAIRCLDRADAGIAGADEDAVHQNSEAPLLGPFFGPDYSCPTWPVPPKPKPPAPRAVGAAPILVIGTTGDPATPYEYAEAMADQLDSGVLITLQGDGHGAYGDNACVDAAVADYFTKPGPPKPVTCS